MYSEIVNSIYCLLSESNVDANAASALVDQWGVFKVRVVALCTELYLCIELFFLFFPSSPLFDNKFWI